MFGLPDLRSSASAALGYAAARRSYLPVKRFLETLGFEVKGVVCGCDLVALDTGSPALVAEFCDEYTRRINDAARREEMEALPAGTKEEAVLLHPSMAGHYRAQVARLADALAAEENRGDAADILRSLGDRITLTPNAEGKLDIDLFGDLAGILSLAMDGKNLRDAKKGDFVRQIRLVAGAGFVRSLANSGFRAAC